VQAQPTRATSLAQLRSRGSEIPEQAQLRVAEYLRDRADKIGSRVLNVLAMRVTDDPFKKVKKMVKDLIVKLMEEATEEAETKGFCDKELTTNEHTRKEKTAAVETLTADIDEPTASVAVLTEEIADLSAQISELEAAVEKATSIRNSEKRKNRETVKDAQDAQAAVAQALGVLKEFYDKAGQATALVQVQAEPEIFSDEPYRGMGGDSGGVVGMIEVIASDFARLESETSASEEAAAKEYKDFMNDSTMDKAMKSKDVEHKTEKKAMQEQALQEKKGDLAGTQKELDAALKYFDKLKPTCVSGGEESFEDRVAQRKEEIESLQEALRILNGEDIALLQQS
jgi:chromosome segregation ATPase